jgi:hypothetical protein
MAKKLPSSRDPLASRRTRYKFSSCGRDKKSDYFRGSETQAMLASAVTPNYTCTE